LVIADASGASSSVRPALTIVGSLSTGYFSLEVSATEDDSMDGSSGASDWIGAGSSAIKFWISASNIVSGSSRVQSYRVPTCYTQLVTLRRLKSIGRTLHELKHMSDSIIVTTIDFGQKTLQSLAILEFSLVLL